MGDRSPSLDVKEKMTSVPTPTDTAQPSTESKNIHTTTSNDVEKDTSLPSRDQHVAQTDIVDWEGEGDPAKPMNCTGDLHTELHAKYILT
jgi:hypothetical protein